MPYVDAQAVAQAREMDLLTYLQNYEPQELVKISGDNYCTRSHDSLKISNGKWYWWSRGFGGYSALDYLVKVRGLRFSKAVETIVGRCAAEPPVYADKKKNNKPSGIFAAEELIGSLLQNAYLRVKFSRAFRTIMLFLWALIRKTNQDTLHIGQRVE